MMFSYKHEALLNTWTFSNVRYCYEARRVMRWMQISLKSLNFQSFRVIKIHTLCNLCFHPKGFEQFQHHLLIHLKLPSILLHTQDLGSLSPWKGKNLVNKIALSLGSFSNDNSVSNKGVKTAIVLLSKQKSLHVHHAFLYISLPLRHDYDVKMPNFTFYGGRKQATRKFSFSFYTWEWFPRNHLQGKLPTLNIIFQRIGINVMKFGNTNSF